MTQTLPLWKNGKEDEQLNNHVLSDVDIEEPAPDTMVNRQTESSESDRPQRTRTIPKRFDDYVLATTNETIPKDYEEAIACEDKKHWENAMLEEIQNMYSHQVWELVPRPVNAKVVKSKWVFKISKDQENKTYKARLVAMGYNQIPGRDYNESFSPVIKNATLRTILSMAATKDSVIKLFDVKAAYLNGNIENTIFMEQPAGFVQDRNKVCKLNKSIYGLPQSGRSWYEKFSQVLHDCGLEKLKSDPCLFKWKNEDKYFYVGIYVDDFITVSDSEDTSNRFINKLRHHLEIKDVTCKGMFLGIKIIQDKEGISLQQSHYVQQILQKYGMENCKEVSTPGSKEINLDNHIEDDNCEQHTYQEALGMLMFLAVNTRPDIAYITSKLSQYSRQPKQMHWTAIKRVMRYLRGTIDLGVKFERGKTGILKSYADASWSTTHDGKSYGGYVLKLGEATIDWKSSKQPLVALSTMEAEMIAACESCCQIKWIINLLRELEEWNFMEKPTAIYTDSQSLINWISSPKQSSRCRHINRKYHFLRDCYESRDICLLYKPSQDLEADIFTKDLSRDQMKKHLESLSIVGIKPNKRAVLFIQKNFDHCSKFKKALKDFPTTKPAYGSMISEYDRVFQEWLAEGFIAKVTSEDLNRKCHYLSHHPVVKANSNTTKIRPVFDASCKDKGNLSLNDCLASGPNVIEQIPAILLKFREKAIGVIADFRKAFLQIEVKEEDRDYLRFLWWKNNHQIQVFRYKRVVFGVTCSPYLLGAVILHHLKGVSSEFGALPQKLMECLYIDNCVTSVDTEAELVDLVEKSTEIFAKAKMDLRMWQFGPIHRVKEVYSRLPPSVDIERSEEASVLGMKWNLLEDTLNVTPKFGVIINSLSKRDLLSHTQQIFDPIGFLAPVLLPAKLLIQQAWTVKTDWDEPLPSTIQENFMKWYNCQNKCVDPEVHTKYTKIVPIRVRDATAFEILGVDLAGPLYLNNKTKAWIVLFTCAVFRDIHLELVTSLSTEAFIQALRKFIARRGRPTVIYSDNGTNFVGANNALKALNWKKIVLDQNLHKISWKFIPPTAAWWGVYYEEMSTILCDAEATINSRPLTYIHEDFDNLIPLSPSMFLHDSKYVGVPDLYKLDSKKFQDRYRHCQRLREALRSRFRSEYLGQLVQKANERTPKLSVGDVVIVKVEDKRRLHWPMARIVELFPGRDGHILGLLKFAQNWEPLYALCRSSTPWKFQVGIQFFDPKDTTIEEEHSEAKRTRCGRVVKPPQRLNL
ncbi:hypothetical protein LAZ67_18002105 [Cordylochernes scorpioides]|uniref:Integrase catalytic domain-containing protein n=1 Tax=Cordylochernes scorpioides TaxID=51811 RepID=A0ABY6LK37_9ARAC|nr:hypothetical protein LAZ67_18002105 [Cordylochernes scorpioides]